MPPIKEREYFPVIGDYTAGMVAADMHVHVTGDTADTPHKTLRAARDHGIHTVVITDHDSTKVLAECEDINETEALGLQIISGVESTAIVEDKKGKSQGPRHVLAYGVRDAPPCYMPLKALNRFVHEQGGYTSAAHPGLGRFSLTHKEIRQTQESSEESEHFDFIEAHNGGVPLLMRFAERHPLITKALVGGGLMPEISDLNEQSRNFFTEMKRKLFLKGVTAGSDTHDALHIGEAVVFYDPAVPLFDAIKQGKTSVMERNYLSETTARGIILGTVGGWRLEIARRLKTGWNGVTVYDKKAVSESND